MSRKRFWSFDGDLTFETHDTAAEAKARCVTAIDHYHQGADEGWCQDVEDVAWGPVSETARMVNREEHHPDCGGDEGCHAACDIHGHLFEFSCDYELQPIRDGASLIAAERLRQVSAEGWTPEHDDEHLVGEMAIASAVYATPAERRRFNAGHYDPYEPDTGKVPIAWPWHDEWYKPTPNDRIRELAKAGALIAAEIDRLIRAET